MGDPFADYLYDLTRNDEGMVPNEPLAYHPSQADLARVESRFHAANDRLGAGGVGT